MIRATFGLRQLAAAFVGAGSARPRQRLALPYLLAVALACAIPCRAQVATGTPLFGSFSGGPDIINNGSNNAHLDVNILTKAGRQLPLPYLLSYDSSVWYDSKASGTYTWTPSPTWGWIYVTAAAVGEVTYTWTQGACHDKLGDVYNYDIYSQWVFYDPRGVPHSAGTLKVSDYSTVVPAGACPPPGAPPTRAKRWSQTAPGIPFPSRRLPPLPSIPAPATL